MPTKVVLDIFWKVHILHILCIIKFFSKSRKKCRWKNNKCSESPEMPTKVVFRHFWKIHILHILCIIDKFSKSRKKCRWKNKKYSESSEMPTKVVFSHFLKMHILHNLCIIIHILSFLGFFWYSLNQYLPPPKRIRIPSPLVLCPASDYTPYTIHNTQHTHHQNIGRDCSN